MITGFQFRAAKAVIGIEGKEIGQKLGLTEATIVRFGHVENMDTINCFQKNAVLLIKFFKAYGVVFPDIDTVSMASPPPESFHNNYLTRFQFKCARIATRLTRKELSQHINVPPSSIGYLESFKNTEHIEHKRVQNEHLINYFNRIGILFPDNSSVRLAKDPSVFFKK